MGYYSDVACVFTPEGYEKFKEIFSEKIKEYWKDYPYKDTDHPDIMENNMLNYSDISPDGFVLQEKTDKKWYEDSVYFPDVRAFMSALNELDDDSYKYLRMGENNDDNEELGGLYDEPFGVGIIRRIEVSNRFENSESIGMEI